MVVIEIVSASIRFSLLLSSKREKLVLLKDKNQNQFLVSDYRQFEVMDYSTTFFNIKQVVYPM